MAKSTGDKLLNEILEGGRARLASTIEGQRECIPTGSLLLDHHFCGGFMVGQLTELYGKPTSGKSLICNQAAAQVTQDGDAVIYYDGDSNHQNKQSNAWREKHGIVLENLYQVDPYTSAEVVMNTIDDLREALGARCKLVIIDSVGELVTEKALGKKAGEALVSDRAKLLWEWLRKVRATNRHAAFVFINQEVAKIGSYLGGNTTPGGDALKFFCHQRIRLKGTELCDSANPKAGAYGIKITAEAKKLKGEVPKLVPFEVFFDYNDMKFDVPEEVLEVAIAHGLLEAKPPFYTMEFQGQPLKIKGRENFKNYMTQENVALYDYLKKAIFEPIPGTEGS